MTGFSAAIAVLSCSLLSAALIKMLAPKGSTEKIMRLVISLFVLICIVSCFKSIVDVVKISDLSDAANSESIEKIDSEIEKSVLKTTGDYMAQYVESLLLSEDIKAEKIEVTVESDEKSVINLTDVSIYIDKSNTFLKSTITEIIEADLDITPKVNVKE